MSEEKNQKKNEEKNEQKKQGQRIFGKVFMFVKKHKFLTFLFFALVIGCCIFGNIRARIAKRQTQVKENTVQTTDLKKRDLTTSVSVTGTIASADKREVTTDLNGVKVTEVAASVGDYVEAGATIIAFDNSDLEDEYETTQDSNELNELKQNQSLNQAQENVEDAQQAYEKGVSEQARLVENALSELNTAKSNESEALSDYENAKKDTEKAKESYEKLKEKESQLKSAMQKAEKTSQKKQDACNQAKADYESAEANIKYASEADENYAALLQAYMDSYESYTKAEKEANEAQNEMQRAKDAYDAIEQARNHYKEAQDAEKQAGKLYEEAVSNSGNKSSAYDKAVETQTDTNEKNADNIKNSKENLTITNKEVSNNKKSQSRQMQAAQEKLGKCVVTSPISGYITAINVAEGDNYNGTDTLFVVQDTNNFVVDATVDEYDIASLKKDQAAVVKTDATGDEELSGVLTYVAIAPEETSGGNAQGASSSAGTSSSASYAIRIALTDTNENLRIGMTAKTSIILESAKDVYAVPYDCVQTGRDGNSFIMVLDEETYIASKDQTAAMETVFVELGIESDYYVEINGDGLTEGLHVVTPETVGVTASGQDSEAGGFFGGQMPGAGMPAAGMPGGERPGGNFGGGGASGGGGNFGGGGDSGGGGRNSRGGAGGE